MEYMLRSAVIISERKQLVVTRVKRALARLMKLFREDLSWQ